MSTDTKVSHISSLVAPFKFDGKNFKLWKLKMTAYLEAMGLLEVVVQEPSLAVASGSASSSVSSGKSTEDKAKKAYSILVSSLMDEQLSLVINVSSGNAHGVWTVLLRRYERKTTASKSHMWSKLHSSKMESKEDFDMYAARITQMIISLEEMGEKVSQSQQIHILLSGLPSSYKSLVQALRINDKLEFVEACTHIRDCEEIENHEEFDKTEAEAYSAHEKKKTSESRTCFTCNKIGHIAYDCPKNKDKKKCSNCRKIGHTTEECRIKSGAKNLNGCVNCKCSRCKEIKNEKMKGKETDEEDSEISAYATDDEGGEY